MWRVTLRGLQGHALRFLLTASAVMLGVAFGTGTFVLRDTIDNSLSSLFSQAYKGTDVAVRGAAVGATLTEGIVVDPTGASSTTRAGDRALSLQGPDSQKRGVEQTVTTGTHTS